MRIIAEQLHGQWSAWFSEPLSPDCYSGETAIEAIERLIQYSPNSGVTIDELTPDLENSHGNRVVMILSSAHAGICADCGGSGMYVGLNVIEQCHTCHAPANEYGSTTV